MVLTQGRRPAWGLAVVLGTALLTTGCLKQVPLARAPQPTEVAVAYVLDDGQQRSSSDVPQEVKDEVARELARRNLVARELPFATTSGFFVAVRNSDRRFAELKKLAPEAPLFLLVETKAEFFNQSQGRYTWTVAAKVTASSAAADATPAVEGLETGASLLYDHQREPEAVAATAQGIAQRAAFLFDGLLAVGAETPGRAPAGDVDSEGTGIPKPMSGAPKGDAVYFVMVDRFANGDPGNDGAIDLADPQAFHGGDLAGVLAKVDHLAALGVKTVWLSPISAMRTEKFFGHGAFHGYWVEDLARLEPRFGDEAVLAELSAALRARGMELVLDVVLNHVGPDTPLVQERPGWFHREGALEDWNDPVQLVRRDVHGLPDLAQEREDVYRHLVDASLAWVSRAGVDGFRLDAVKHVPLEFWARYNAEIRQTTSPRFWLLGELLDGDVQKLARTQTEGGFAQMFDFPLAFALVDVFCRGRSPEHLGSILSLDRVYPAPGSLVTLLDNHDLPRVTSLCGGDLEKVKRALAVQLTARGVPALTWGIEAGMTGEKEPENRKTMDWSGPMPLREWIAQLMRARHESPALAPDAPQQLLRASDGVFAYARVVGDEAVIIAVNGGRAPAELSLPAAAGKVAISELLGGAPVTSLTVTPGAVALWRVRPGELGGLVGWTAAARTEWRGESARVEATFTPPPTVKVAKGETLWLVGGAPELGAWDPARGVGPVGGQGARVTLPVGSVVEFKWVRKKRDGAFLWEDGANHLRHLVGDGPAAAASAN